ncbi:hypothetical protein CDD82_250 [Ophiocordyceps australis]|uniref:Cell division control protein n=1 Tax=Ophiocordyceps australis TaxID=1399860 RepID=A0A2C5ZQR4_9HYPO|nr:hypothetical protein CDD82_250 [Ophiocordyceps australis]
MARSALGKRGRVLSQVDSQTRRKRTRLQVKQSETPNRSDQENCDPRHVTSDSEHEAGDEIGDAIGDAIDDEAAHEIAQLPGRTRKLQIQTLAIKSPVTPSTPRHRDVLSGGPTTPRHAVMSAGKLFKRMTPQSCFSPSTIQTVYQSARQLFAREADAGQLVGRESERDQLVEFLSRCSSSSPSGCVYVSGPPGTGKSAMITHLMREHSHGPKIRSAYINCMSIKSSKALYDALVSELGLQGGSSDADAVTALQQAFCPRTKSSTVYQVTLDEMDHVLTMDLESLYRVMEWSMHKSSRLVLIGIANALDLTDRFLPRLKAKNLKPQLLPFLPYTAPQIKTIVVTRLKSLLPAGKQDYVPFLHPAAIELCSRKVSSQTGDLRKAFEICRRALELIETETRSKHQDEAREKLLQLTPSKKPLGEKINMAAAEGSSRSVLQIMTASLGALTAETAPRASIGHVNKITAAAFSNGTTQRLKTLNLQQKATLCALVAYENRARAPTKAATTAPLTPSKTRTLAPSIKMLFNAYRSLCTWDSVLYPLASSEFREVVGSLETLGLINTVDGRTGSFATPQTPSKRGRKVASASGDEKRIASSVSEKEVEAVTEGPGAGILRSILAGEALDLMDVCV